MPDHTRNSPKIYLKTAIMLILITCVIAGGVSAQPSFSPDQGKIPLKVRFTLPGGDACDSVSWEFGDGKTSREINPQHTYKGMGFYPPHLICTLPGATVTYTFDKIVASNADMPDADSNNQHYPAGTKVKISPAQLELEDLLKQADGLYALGLGSYAVSSYKKASRLSGSDPRILGKYGDVLASLSRWSEAAAVYNQSLAIKETPVVLNAYGGMMIKMNRYQDALDAFNRTLAINAKNPVALTGKGKAFEMLVKNIGLPSHSELDPTPFAALSFLLIFGVMFGDIGQGLVLSAAGAALRIAARRRRLAPALGDAGDSVGAADIESVERLAAAFPDVRFLVTVLARENTHALCVAARKFANLVPFGCWWFLNNPSLIREQTAMRLEMLGLSFVPQHSDSRVLDQLIYKWAHARAVIGEVLADQYDALSRAGWRADRAGLARDVARLFDGSLAGLSRPGAP